MHLHRRSREQCGRADTRSDTEENLCHADANAAQKKEEFLEHKENIAFANTERVAEKEVFPNCARKGIAHAVAERIAQEEKTFADADTKRFTTSKEKVPCARRDAATFDVGNSVADFFATSKKEDDFANRAAG